MNFQIVKTAKIPWDKRPVHLKPMAELLGLIGVEKVPNGFRNPARIPIRHRNSESFLYDTRDKARAKWITQIRAAGHDFTENHETCARLNAIWTTLKKRFAAKGIC